MPTIITRVFHKPEGGVNRKVVERDTRAGSDGHLVVTMIEKHLKQYPESGRDENGYWARDAEGRRYTFDAKMSD
jgi:hypothetical protein